MRRLRSWALRFIGLFDSAGRDRAIQDEIDSHLQLHVDDNIRAGLAPQEARRKAVLDLGGIEALKEVQRDRSGIPALQHLGRDLGYAARVLRRNPTFSLVIIATLGLAIGANTAIFTIVNAVLLDPLPYQDSHRLALVWSTDQQTSNREISVSYPDFEAWRDNGRSFSSLAALTGRSVTLRGADQAELVPAIQTTPAFFDVLGVAPVAGRFFTADDANPDRPEVAVVSDAAWKRQLGGRLDAIGKPIVINGRPYVVIGVAPSALHFLPTEVEQVYTLLPRETNRSHAYLRVVGRLRPGVTFAMAQAELDVLSRQTAAAFPATHATTGARVVRLVEAVGAPARDGLVLLLCLVGAVLLIACANIANLTLARHASRQHELALRVSLGAGRLRIMQQLACESLLLAGAGGISGLVFGWLLMGGLLSVLSTGVPVPRLDAIGMDGTVLMFCAAATLASGLLFGIGPAIVTVRGALAPTTRESSRTLAGSRGGYRLRAALVIIESALALVLLAAGASFARAFVELRATAPGFAVDDVLAVGVRMPGALTPGPAREAFFKDVTARLEQMPAVRAAGFVSSLPMAGGADSLQFRVEGDATGKPRSANVNLASPGYFRAMRIPVIQGREFAAADTASAPAVVVINESAARRFWPGRDAVGGRLTLTGAAGAYTVVGITGDVRQSDLGIAPRPEIYLSALQPGPDWNTFSLAVHAQGDPLALVPDVRAVLLAVNRDVAIAKVGSMRQLVSGRLALPRVFTSVLGAFAGLAVLLAAVGLYGLIAYSVTQRTRELGVRLALGSEPSALARSVLGQGARLTTIGIVIGLVAASFTMQAMARVLPSIRPGDPVTLAAVAVMMVIVGGIAAYLPARRAARVDPLVALRAE